MMDLGLLGIAVGMLSILVIMQLQHSEIRQMREDVDRLETAMVFCMEQLEKLNPEYREDMKNYLDKLREELK